MVTPAGQMRCAQKTLHYPIVSLILTGQDALVARGGWQATQWSFHCSSPLPDLRQRACSSRPIAENGGSTRRGAARERATENLGVARLRGEFDPNRRENLAVHQWNRLRATPNVVRFGPARAFASWVPPEEIVPAFSSYSNAAGFQMSEPNRTKSDDCASEWDLSPNGSNRRPHVHQASTSYASQRKTSCGPAICIETMPSATEGLTASTKIPDTG